MCGDFAKSVALRTPDGRVRAHNTLKHLAKMRAGPVIRRCLLRCMAKRLLKPYLAMMRRAGQVLVELTPLLEYL